uniref:BTB domain-containing protein n=1 Tax=Panagrellus redivivus TaxID=6233 RepID=A0A7E4UN39_PANRE
MINVETKTLKSSATIPFVKSEDTKGKTLSSYKKSKSRVFPGQDEYEWWFNFCPAVNEYSSENEKNHVKLALNLIPAAEGRVTIEAEGLPTKTYDFPKCKYFDWFYVHQAEFYAAIEHVLVLKCTVEIDVDFVPKIRNFCPKPDVYTPLYDSMFSEMQITGLTNNLKVTKTLKDEINIPLRKSVGRENKFWNPETTQSQLELNSNVFRWSVTYVHDKEESPVSLIFIFCPNLIINVNARLTVEAEGLPTKTYTISNSGKFYFDHFPYQDVFNAIIDDELNLKCTLELTVDTNFVPEIRTEFCNYNDIEADFEIHRGDDHYKVHKVVLSKISPIFKSMLEHNFAKSSSNKLVINDFDFKTIKTAMNIVYGRPWGKISVGLALDVLYFVDKYKITDFFDELEEVLTSNLSMNNFYAILRYANECAKTDLFAKCAALYKDYEDTIKTAEPFLALPGPLVIKLLKCAFQFENELDVFYHARQKGICVDVVIEPSTVEIQTLADFLKVVPYAWKYYIEDLKVKCAQFYQQNKAEVEKSWEFQSYPKMMQQALSILGRPIEARTDFREYENVPTDFEIQCGENQLRVHKDVLSQISPVFEAMLRHNFVETSSNKIEINDFDFKTIETALNICYGRSCGDLSTELMLDILYFADKYHIADIFTQLEEVLTHNLSTTNFCTVFHCANDFENTGLFAECVKFYKQNKSNIKIAEATLPFPLVFKLVKSAYQLKTELDAFMHARRDGFRLDIEELEVPTLADFFKTVPYAWEKYEDGLKMKCAKFWQDNKDTVRKTEEYSSFSRSIKEELDVLGACFE